MKLQVVGCNHHNTSISVRERLAFQPEEVPGALELLRNHFPSSEAVLLSTCNRVEVFIADRDPHGGPTHHDVADFLAGYHGLNARDIFDELFERTGEDAVRHLFAVAAGLDSQVVGEPQILSQVKAAYELATNGNSTGPLTHAVFQAALRVAKRITNETTVHQRRVSIPSIAIADFAKQIFERFDDKRVLVIGAGDMGEETLRYLVQEGARNITVVNRNYERAEQLAARYGGQCERWDKLLELLAASDLVISTTGAEQPIVREADFKKIKKKLDQRPLLILDLAVPRDFDEMIGRSLGVYLYSLDDLKQVCDANRRSREKQWPKAESILTEETAHFMAKLHNRSTGPTIKRLKDRANELKRDELNRLWNKLEGLDERSRAELSHSFDRLVNKLLHPPLESLRDEAERGTSGRLLEALKKLFQLKD